MTFPLPDNTSLDEKLAAFDSVPLFMKSLPEEGLSDPVVSALQSLAYEGTPDEIAQNFKEQGNEYFKGKRYREALGFYAQGIDAKPTDPVLREALLCNRAACNLELKNYGSVLRDCSQALTINPDSSKAYYRSAAALIALERLDEALDCCNRCLLFDKDNTGIQTFRKKAAELKAFKDQKERDRLARIQEERAKKQRLQLLLWQRNIIILNNPNGTSSDVYEPRLDPEDPAQETLLMPVLFLYPQCATSDIIPDFEEDAAFSAHIAKMFPPQVPAPEWDQQGEYVDGRLVVYAITHRRRLLKIGKKMTLRDVFKASAAKEGEPRDGLEAKDGCLSFVVLPKGDVEQKWVEDFKKSRGVSYTVIIIRY